MPLTAWARRKQHLPSRRQEAEAVREAPADRVDREVGLLGLGHLRLHEAWGSHQVLPPLLAS